MISLDKQYKTRGGDKVRLFAIDVKRSGYPICGVIISPYGDESVISWTEDGKYYSLDSHNCQPHPYDLVEVKQTRTLPLWLNIFPHQNKNKNWFTLNYSKENADTYTNYMGKDRIACKEITITFTEGEGL